ncbi:hypothetical protein, partial [uncultured Thiocystis sp.]|uniref:hypothetical protein n=1 Tax=uncultured Thiocystis sp. TaxID=1202134 RepID=UPI0025DA74C0
MSIHADGDNLAQDDRIPVKVALVNGDRKVCVEELGPAVGKERLFQSVHAEPASRVWGRRQVPDAN